MSEAPSNPAAPVAPPAAPAAPAAPSGEAWYPDTAKDYVTNKGWKAPADLLTSYQGLETLVGAERAGRTVVMPKDANDADGLKAFRAKLGVPESADKYTIPDGLKADPLIGGFRDIAHKANISGTAFNELLDWTLKQAADNDTKLKAQAQTESQVQLEALKGEWGKDFDAKAEYARRFLKAAGWDDAKMAKYEEAFGTATMLKDFHAWGSKVGEPGFATGTETSFTPQKAQVQAKITEITQKRIAGQISQKEFLAEMAVLGPQSEAAA